MKTPKIGAFVGMVLMLTSLLSAQNAYVSFRTAPGISGPWCPIMTYVGGPQPAPMPDNSFIGIYLTGPDNDVDYPGTEGANCGGTTDDDVRATGNTIGSGGLDHLIIHPNEPAQVPPGNLYSANGTVTIPAGGSGVEPIVNIGDRMYLRAFNSTTNFTATHYNDLLTVGGVTQNWFECSVPGVQTVIVCFTEAMPVNCISFCSYPAEAAGPETDIMFPGESHYFFHEAPTYHCTLWMTAGVTPIYVTATLLNQEPQCKPFPNTTYMTRIFRLEGVVSSIFDIGMGYSQNDYDACSWHNLLETGMHVAYYDGDYTNCIGRWVKVQPPVVIIDSPDGGYAEFSTNHLSMWSFGWGNVGDTTQLPVELTDFRAMAGDQSVRLDWTTASETDNAGFYIQRSTTTNDKDFVIVSDLIPTQGNGATSHDYTWTDTRLNNGMRYYFRLVDEDINGNAMVHPNVVYATPSVMGEAGVLYEYKLYQNFPNPFNNRTSIAFDVVEEGKVTLRIYDVMGRKVKTLVDENRPTGRYIEEYNADGLSSGIYFYRVKVKKFTDTKKMLLVQ